MREITAELHAGYTRRFLESSRASLLHSGANESVHSRPSLPLPNILAPTKLAANTISVASTDTIQRAHHRARHVATGVVVGAVVGALAGSLQGHRDKSSCSGSCEVKVGKLDMVVAIPIGALLGGLIGAAWPP